MEWVLLAYRMPREPSTPRIAVWRKLRKLGAVQLVDGLVALPSAAPPAAAVGSGEGRVSSGGVGEEVIDAGGEAWTFAAQPGTKRQDAALRSQISTAVAEEYRALIED